MQNLNNKVGHRSSEDEKWQQVKDEVFKRDKGLCRCCITMTPTELAIRNSRNIPSYFLTNFDAAHYESVGNHVEKTYDINNIFTLCRSCHSALDSYNSPATGKQISKEEHEQWWNRIKNSGTITNNTTKKFDINNILDSGLKNETFNPEKWLDN